MQWRYYHKLCMVIAIALIFWDLVNYDVKVL